MPNKTQFSDYESLTRPKISRDSGLEVDEEGWSAFRPNREVSESGGFAVGTNRAKTRETNSRKEVAAAPLEPPSRGNWVLKRGHAASFVGLLLFTFLVYFRPYEWSPSLTWLSSSAFLVATFTLAVFIPTQLGMEGNLTSRPREVDLVLLLLLASLLSIPLALDRLRAWNSFTEYLKVVLMFVVMVNVIRSEKRLKALLFLVLIASCVLSVSALNDIRMGNLALRGQRIAGAIGGLFQNPNDLALHLVTMIPITVALLLTTRALAGKAFYVVCLLLSLIGIVMTFSRGGFIGLMCAGGVLSWRLARRNKLLLPAVLCTFLLLLIVLAPGGYGSRLSTTDDDSAAARTDDLKRSLFIAARHPLLGVGMDNYVLYSNSDHATHNAYTQVASELGLTAAVLYIMFLIVPIKQLRKISRETGAERRRSHFFYFAVGLEASLVGYMVSSFFGSVAYVWYAYYLVAYAICIRRLYEVEKGKKLQEIGTTNREPAADSSYNPAKV